MIYISLDNDYHGEFVLKLIKMAGIEISGVTIICHKSMRNNIILRKNYKIIKLNGHPLSDGSGYKNILSYLYSLKHQRQLDVQFKFKTNDVLLITTEHQLNNALLAKKMKKSGGRVYIFDEGIGFYINNSNLNWININFLDRIYLFLYRFIFFTLGIPALPKKGNEGRMFITTNDKLIDLIYSSINLDINRTIPIRGYRNFLITEENVGQNQNSAIFFANNLDCFQLKNEELQLSGAAIDRMAAVFEKVYIKVHPGDLLTRNDIYFFYKNLAMRYPNTYFIEDDMTGNGALIKYGPKFAIGTVGTAIFDAIFLNCQPIFLFHLLPKSVSHVDNIGFSALNSILQSKGYKFIDSVSEISLNYNSGLKRESFLHHKCDLMFDFK